MNDLERRGSFSSIDSGPLKRVKTLRKKSHNMKSLRLLTRMLEAVENTKSAADSVQRPGRKIHEGVADDS